MKSDAVLAHQLQVVVGQRAVVPAAAVQAQLEPQDGTSNESRSVRQRLDSRGRRWAADSASASIRQQGVGLPKVPLRNRRPEGILLAAEVSIELNTALGSKCSRKAQGRVDRFAEVMLSVFMTPWMKPTPIQRATNETWRSTTARSRPR